MIRRLSITFLLCISSVAASAQISQDRSLVDEGSTYSQFGVGFPVDYGNSAASGMGLIGVSYNEPFVPSAANPAHWGSTVYAMATGGIGINSYSGQDNFGSAENSLLYIDQFQLQIPVYKNKLAVSASFLPYSRASYQVIESELQVVGSGSSADSLSITSQNTGSGGVQKIEIGFGWKINSNIAVGYAPSIVFSSIDNEFITSLGTPDLDRGTVYAPVNFTEQISGVGYGHRFGVLFNLPSIFGEEDQLTIGGTLNLPVELEGERVQENNRIVGDADEDGAQSVVINEGTMRLPLGLAGGVTYRPSNKLAVSSEVLYQQWSDYSNTIRAGNPQVYTDRMKLGAGLSYFPFVTGSDNFFSNFKYRIGASYDSGHLEIQGQNIDTIMFSAGLGLLSPNSRSSIDLSFEYGIRGTQDQNLVQEDIWGFKLSLNLAELFFFRPQLQ